MNNSLNYENSSLRGFDLNGAIERREFFLQYQPIVELQSAEICGAEALVRWALPGKNIVMPNAFVPFAEQTGLIVPIGERVLELACQQLSVWQEDFPSFSMAVNVSVVQLLQRDFAATVTAYLNEYSIEASRLKIEITETAKIESVSAMIGQLEALSRTGVAIVLDDFGTGYSSLSHLASLPVKELKIDRRFTRGLPDDPTSQAIVTHIAALARDLGLSVVMEGVESQQQVDWLRAFPDIKVQGSFYSMPVSAHMFWSGKRRFLSPAC
jgi:EAL domain-containing protein (putative c-di-GMP-specific phosphodiesterase class I)